MNKFVSAQLKKIVIPRIYIDNNPNKIIFKKQGANIDTDFIVFNTYNILVEDYILNPPPGFTLADNWNFGTNPPEKELTAKVLQIAGKMIKFDCIGKTTNINWVGWLPKKSIKIV